MNKQYIKKHPIKIFQICIAIIAIIATTGSLYLSLGLGLVPCKFCWYQRILMYPLVPISLYSIYKQDLFAPLILTLSTAGIIISYYHSLLQLSLAGATACSSLCGAVLYTVGPLSIPNLSAIAFTLITILTITAYYLKNKHQLKI